MKAIFARLLAAAFAAFASAPTIAAINPVPEQCVTDSWQNQTSETINATDGWVAPAAGNYLVSILSLGDGAVKTVSHVNPSGFVTVEDHRTGSISAIVHITSLKTAVGDETSFTTSWTNNASDGSFVMCEFASTDLEPGGPVASEEDIAGVGNSGQTIGTGSAANTVADALAIAVFSVASDSLWDDNSYGDSFTERYEVPAGSIAPINGVRIATKVVSSIASQSSSLTTTDTGSQRYGMIMVFDGIVDVDPPTYSVNPALDGAGLSNVTGHATAADAVSSTVEHCLGVYADGSAAPDPADVCSGAGMGYQPGTVDVESRSNGVSASLQSNGSIASGTPFEAFFTVRDQAPTPNYAAVQGIGFTTEAVDTTPNAFNYTDQTGVPLSTLIEFAPIVVSGINSPAAITVSGDTQCEYKINSGVFTAAPGNVNNGDSVAAHVESSGAPLTATNCGVTIGGVGDTATATTLSSSSVVGLPALAHDTLTGAGSIVGHALDLDAYGAGWQISGTYSTTPPGTITIVGNKMSVSPASVAVLNVGTRNKAVTVAWTPTAAQTNQAVTAARYVDSNNWFYCRALANNNVQLRKDVAGQITTLASATKVWTLGNTYELTSVTYENGIGCVVDGVLLIPPINDPALLTATKIAIGSEDGSTTPQIFDDVYVWQTFSGIDPATGKPIEDPQGMFFGASGLVSGSFYWQSVSVAGSTPIARTFDYGGRFYINPQLNFVGNTTWTTTRYVPTTASLVTSVHTDVTVDTAAPEAPALDPIPNQSCDLNTDPGVFSLSDYVTNLATANPAPEYEITAGGLVPGRTLSRLTGDISGLCSDNAGSPYSVTVRATNTAGNSTARTFTQTVNVIVDTVPDSFGFTLQSNVPLSTAITSNTITPSGYNADTTISISGGTYSINAGAFTPNPGTLSPGDTVAVRVTSSGSNSTTTAATLTIGGVSGVFQVTTLAAAPDTVPNAFSFEDVTDVALGSEQTDTIVVSGINTASPISIVGGAYQKNGAGGFVSTPGTVVNGDSIEVKHTASNLNATTVNTTLTIGGVSDTFSSTTIAVVPAPDTTPDAFVFVDVVNSALGSVTESNAITITGIDTAAPISIVGGQYRVNGVGAYRNTPGTVSVNDTVIVRVTNSSLNNTPTSATLTIGSVSDTYTSTTLAVVADTTPDQFSFIDKTDVPRNVVVTSDPVVVTGITTAVPISVSGGSYSKNSATTFTAAPGTVVANDVIRLRGLASALGNTPVNVTVTIGGVSDTFTFTTGAGAGCVDIPTQNLVTGAAFSLDVSVYCANFTDFSYSFLLSTGAVISDPPTDFNVSGSVISSPMMVVPQRFIVLITASGPLGTASTSVTIDVRTPGSDAGGVFNRWFRR